MGQFEIDPLTPVPDLLARFTVKRGFLRRDRIEVRVYLLQHDGCVIKSDEAFNPGDSIQLDLVLAMPFENIEASSLQGHVTDVRKYCSNFFYTIEFDLNSSDNDITDRISRLNSVLKRKRALRQRRQDTALRERGESSLTPIRTATSSGF